MEERKTTLMLPLACITMLASFSGWLKSICIPKRVLLVLSPFKGEHLERVQTSQLIFTNGKPLGSHMIGSKYHVYRDYYTMIGWIICGIGNQVLVGRSPIQILFRPEAT